MNNKNFFNKTFLMFGIFVFLIVVFSFSIHAVTLPSNLQKIVNYNNEQATFYLKNLSFIIAFIAGILTILTPCSLALFPAFFAYTFKEKREITKMTFSFFIGFMPIFVIFGLIATFFGKSISVFQQDNGLLVTIAGFLIIFFGLMVLLGKGFSGIKFNNKSKDKSALSIFIFGVLFSLGFTACSGPILVGILLIASVFQNYLYAGVLMFFYSFGLFVPLFLISILFDKYNFLGFINKLNKKIGFSITNFISGILLILIGGIFIIFRNTSITNSIGLGNVTVWVYSIQNKIVLLRFINIIGLIILIGFIYLIWRILKKEIKWKKK